MSLFNVFNIANSAVSAQAQRLNTVASNLANAESASGTDGKPYQARHVVFESTTVNGQPGATAVKVRQVVADQEAPRKVYDPKHPLADREGYVLMPNVNVADEMVDMISAARAYQTNVDVMNTAKTLLLKALTLGNPGV